MVNFWRQTLSLWWGRQQLKSSALERLSVCACVQIEQYGVKRWLVNSILCCGCLKYHQPFGFRNAYIIPLHTHPPDAHMHTIASMQDKANADKKKRRLKSTINLNQLQ